MKSVLGSLMIVCFFASVVGFFVLNSSTSRSLLDSQIATSAVASSSPLASRAHVRVVPDGFKEYRNNDYRFSVLYPDDLPVQEEHDRGHSLTVWFQGGGGEEGFQIYAAPINGKKITPERFKLDEPSGVKQAEKDVSVDGTPAMAFYGANEPMGQTYEIWFTHDGLLYEVMTYKELEPWLNEIIQTWRFR